MGLKSKAVLFLTLISVVNLVPLSSGFILTESEQITLEVCRDLLPLQERSKNVSDHLREIRRFCPAVAEIQHDPKWTPGELIMPWMELNRDRGKYIPAINESEYGPITSTSPSEIFPDALFQFTRPYNPVILGKMIENLSGYKNSPNFSTKAVRNEIFYFIPSIQPPSGGVVHYCIKKRWKTNDRICTHIWEFRVATSNGISVTLQREYGDKLALLS